MWLVFLLMMLSIFIVGLIVVWVANKVMIAIEKDNDKYEDSKKINEREVGIDE